MTTVATSPTTTVATSPMTTVATSPMTTVATSPMTTVATSPMTSSASPMYPMLTPMHASRKSADPHILGELTPEQLLFLSNFIKETAFYIEQLESYIGEYLDEFWEDREYAYHLTTDLLIDTLQQQPLEERG